MDVKVHAWHSCADIVKCWSVYSPKGSLCLVRRFQKCGEALYPLTIKRQERWRVDMGGRGTFAVGNNVAYTYETVGKIEGIKVLQGLTPSHHGLPEEAHSSPAYIKLNPDGSVKQIRLYNSNHTAKIDIEFSIHQGKLTLHAHDYVNGVRQPPRKLTPDEYALFGNYWR